MGTVTGSAEVNGTGSANKDVVTVNLTIKLKDWQADNFTLNGDIQITFELKVEGTLLTNDLKISSETTISGTVQVAGSAGKINIPAKIDMKIKTENVAVVVCGEIAGFSVGSGPCS